MRKSGFSMIELVFVIVILGVLAAVAVPRFVTTRTDAQVAMFRSDIASTLKAVPARVFAENIDTTASAPKPFSSWGEWIIDTGGLDKAKWKVSSFSGMSGVAPSDARGTMCNQKNKPGVVWIDTATGALHFDPTEVASLTGGSTLCESLKKSYPSGSNRVIPLATTGAVKF